MLRVLVEPFVFPCPNCHKKSPSLSLPPSLFLLYYFQSVRYCPRFTRKTAVLAALLALSARRRESARLPADRDSVPRFGRRDRLDLVVVDKRTNAEICMQRLCPRHELVRPFPRKNVSVT